MNNTHEEDKHLKLHQLIAKYYDPKYTTVDRYSIKDCAAFNKTDDEWGVFSNFAPTPLTVVGVTFVNSEQLFQMMKFNDPEALKDFLGIMILFASDKKTLDTRHSTLLPLAEIAEIADFFSGSVGVFSAEMG